MTQQKQWSPISSKLNTKRWNLEKKNNYTKRSKIKKKLKNEGKNWNTENKKD